MSFLIQHRDCVRENRPGATVPKGVIDVGEVRVGGEGSDVISKYEISRFFPLF